MTTQAPAQIWFLTGSQTLYGDEVLAQVAEQSGAIARTLEISTATVRSHISHLLPKLNATNRTQAAMQAKALGMLGDSHQ